METQNVLIVSAGEEGWGDPGLLPVLLLPVPHGFENDAESSILGVPLPHPVPAFPPPHSRSQQRTKPETGADGIRSSPCPAAAGAGRVPGPRLWGMQRLCHGLILENNRKAAGRKDAGGMALRGLFLIKV